MEKPPFSMASVYHTKQAGAIKKETSEGGGLLRAFSREGRRKLKRERGGCRIGYKSCGYDKTVIF